MKRLSCFLFAVCAFLTFSCSDDSDKSHKNSILGVWVESWIWSDGKWKSLLGWRYGIYEFKSDNSFLCYLGEENYKSNNPNEILSGTYTFDGKKLSMNGGFKHDVEFSEDGNQMKIKERAIYDRYKAK